MVGAPGSPYSRKLRAVLRFRRIPFVWVQSGGPEHRGLPRPRVELLPQLILRGKDGALEARVDSTPLIRELALEPSESDWITRDAIPDTLRALFGEVGRVYAPFLLANAAALARGAERVDCTIDGRPWVQAPFPYQGKCLQWLREGHAALAPDARNAVDAALEGTGCERLFTV